MSTYSFEAYNPGCLLVEIWRDKTDRISIHFPRNYRPNGGDFKVEFVGDMAIITDTWDPSIRFNVSLAGARHNDIIDLD